MQPNLITLGQSDIQIPPLGVGAWSWGDRLFWRYGYNYKRKEVEEAFTVSVNAGLKLFDTAEIYGFGECERILGDIVRNSQAKVIVATKYMPWFWRTSIRSLPMKLDNSLKRLGLSHIDLYQVHWPPSIMSENVLMNALADAVQEGKIRAVGVSNYNVKQMIHAHKILARRGIPLVSNQAKYNLLKRTPEVNGLITACHDLGVTLIAYSPLAKGLLTGKYNSRNLPSGPRKFTFLLKNWQAIQKVTDLLQEIAQDHGGKTPAQVALNWLICQGALPIPGAKNAHQARENAGALGWSLTTNQIDALNKATLVWRH